MQPLALDRPVHYTLHMLSDWHIGTGQGQPGGIDRLIWRDEDGLPYVPASTLIGVWRDACEVVAAALDNPNNDNPCESKWSEWVGYLFGSQQPAHGRAGDMLEPAHLKVEAARIEERLRKALRSKPRVREEMTFVKPGVKIDPFTGVAAHDMLRFEEVARAGVELYGSILVTGTLDDDQMRTAGALLILGARFLERLGAKRRRGYGRCQLILYQDNADSPDKVSDEVFNETIGWVHNACPASVPSESTVEFATDQPDPLTQEGGWITVKMHCELKTPVVVPRRTIGNVQLSGSRIPGWLLMPVVLGSLRNTLPQVDAAARAGQLIVTDATPEIDGAPSRPIPFAMAHEKGSESANGEFWNRLKEPEPEGKQVKLVREGFIGNMADGKLPGRAFAEHDLVTHNVIDDETGRPNAGVGGVYSVEALTGHIASGSEATTSKIFRCELRVRREVLDDVSNGWQEKLNGRHFVGRKTRGDYGQIYVEAEEPIPVPDSGLGESEGGSSESELKELRVWLLSDTLVRNERLRPSTDPEDIGREIATRLGVAKDSVHLRRCTCADASPNDRGSSENLLHWVSRTERIDSWQRRWGLPRTSLVGIAAGSCGVFVLDEPVTQKQVAELEIGGIGERRGEGFGQLSINDPLLSECLSKYPSDDAASSDTDVESSILISTEEASYRTAQLFERAAWTSEILRRAEVIAANAEERKEKTGITSDISPAQLGVLRSIVGRFGPDGGKEAMCAWVKGIDKVPDRSKKWGKVPGKVKDLLEKPGCIWEHLDLGEDSSLVKELVITTDGEQRLRKELWWDALRALLVQSLNTAGKQAGKNDTNKSGS